LAMKWMRINLLCVIGAIIGTISIFLPWWYSHGIAGSQEFYYPNNLLDSIGITGNLPQTAIDASHYFLAAITAIVFIVGTILAYLSPVGGLLQVPAAVFYCFIWIVDSPEPAPVGVILGLASGITSLYSWFRPLGIGYDAPLSLKEKKWNFKKKL